MKPVTRMGRIKCEDVREGSLGTSDVLHVRPENIYGCRGEEEKRLSKFKSCDWTFTLASTCTKIVGALDNVDVSSWLAPSVQQSPKVTKAAAVEKKKKNNNLSPLCCYGVYRKQETTFCLA